METFWYWTDQVERFVFFDSSGAFLHASGGQGFGPGEFSRPTLVPTVRFDSLLIYDGVARRLTTLTSSGQVLDIDPIGENGDPPISGVLGVVGDMFLTQHWRRVFYNKPGPDPEIAPVRYDLVAASGEHVRSIGLFPGQAGFTAIANGQIGWFEVPFDIMPSAAAGNARVYVNGADRPGVLEYDSVGRLRRILRLREPPRPISRELLRQFLADKFAMAGLSSSSASYQANLYDRMDLPKFIPTFQRVIVDESGHLWAELWRLNPGAAAIWIIFDLNGNALGSVAMPKELEVHQIGNDFVIGRWRDSVGVEYLRRHRLTRTRTATSTRAQGGD